MKGSKLYKKLYKKAKKRAFQTPMSLQNDLEKYAKKMSKKMTAPERAFQTILKKNKIVYQAQFILMNKIFDYYLPDTKTLVEIDGDYWHGNPEVYEEFSGYQKHIKRNDVMKKNIALGMGYKHLQFWEKDLKENKQSVIDKLKLAGIIKTITI